MWECPKCGREFKNENQNHFCGEKPKTIDEYISIQAEDIQQILHKVRDTIHAAIPEAEERISWSMPTFWKKQNIIHFSAHKNHLGVYPGSEAIEHFSEQLVEYKSSKGAVQFPYNKPIPYELIAEIAKWCYKTGNHH
jgi:uncharacterized protein YdhG (YjbR/CyaY superfamily)